MRTIRPLGPIRIYSRKVPVLVRALCLVALALLGTGPMGIGATRATPRPQASSVQASGVLYLPLVARGPAWTSAVSMAHARSGHTATLLPNGTVLIAGGVNVNSLASAEVYDPTTGTWEPTGVMREARYGHTATLLPNGTVLVVGGVGSSNLAEVYDPTTGTWELTGAMREARYGHTATLLPNGTVLVAGGAYTSSVEVYDPHTGQWQPTEAMSEPRAWHTATLLPNGTVLVAGGVRFPNILGETGSSEIYNPTTARWQPTAKLAQARNGHTATLLPSGSVLVTGGSNCSSLKSAEIYNPTTGQWQVTGAMREDRAGHTATLLPHGTILVAGGRKAHCKTTSFALSSAELYDPNTEQWDASSPLTEARSSHTATLLANDAVLVVGGWNPAAVASVEIYR